MLETWYFAYKQYPAFDKLIDKIEENHLLYLDEIEKYSKETVKEFLNNKTFTDDLTDRLLIQAYVSNLAKLKISSATAYSLCFKNQYMEMFIESMADKGIYHYFADIIYNETKDLESIFKKGAKSNYTKDELELLMSQIEEKWS